MSFSVLGFPVEIKQGAWVLAGVVLLFGLAGGSSLYYIAGAIAVGAFSILVHELGHATAARALGGKEIRIELHGMGGATSNFSSAAGVEFQ